VVREGKTHQLDNIISTSFDQGMISLERALAKLVADGKVSKEVARSYTIRPEEFDRLVK